MALPYRFGSDARGAGMIPFRLSMTWKTADLPPRAAALRADWLRLNPGLELRLYDDAGARQVVADMAPDQMALYDALPHGVMRADLFRLAVLLRDGGVYADIDMQVLRPLPPALFQSPCTVMEEAHLDPIRQRELRYAAPVQIANCIMAGAAGHPFFRAGLMRAFDLLRAHPQPIPKAAVEDLTGPRMITRLIYERAWPDVMIAPQIQFMAPLDYPAIWPIGRHMVTRHETAGSWKEAGARASLRRRWIERNRLINPLRLPAWRAAIWDKGL